MRRSTVLLAATIAILGCGTGAGAASAPAPARQGPVAAPSAPSKAPAQDRLYLTDGSSLKVVSGATGDLLRTLPTGAAPADWSRIFSLASGPAGVTLQAVDALTGQVQHAVSAPSWADEVRVSANGAWLALGSRSDSKVTRFQVRDSDLARQPVEVELNGRFVFDGLSGDGQRLYLLQMGSGGSYQVRVFDVGKKQLAADPIVDKTDSSVVMSGTAVNSLTTHDGLLQLTLYERNQKGQAFVHALPIGSPVPFAYCVDLPAPGSGWTLAAAPDGERFYAVNTISNQVVTLTTRGLDPPRVNQAKLLAGAGPRGLVAIAEAKEGVGRPALAVSADGSTLFLDGPGMVTSVEARSMRRSGVASVGAAVGSLAAAPSGWLYAMSSGGQLLRIDPSTMKVMWSSDPTFNGFEILHAG